jgi:hypothetical protein
MARYEDSDFVSGEDFDALFSDEEESPCTSSSVEVNYFIQYDINYLH